MLEHFKLSGHPDEFGTNWLRFGCGGVLCTAQDLMAFDAALSAEKLLPTQWVTLACTLALNDYGLCWRVTKTAEGDPLWWSDGGFPGFIAEFFRRPEREGAFVVLAAQDSGAQKLRGVVAGQAGDCPALE